MTDHATTTNPPLDHESILKTLFDAIDSAAEADKKLHGCMRLSMHLERIKHQADQYREIAY